MKLRTAARAIVIQNNHILVSTYNDGNEVFYTVPGGGQAPGENLADTVRRECLEEAGIEVEVGELRFVREFIGNQHYETGELSELHQIEIFFLCTLKEGQEATTGNVPDPNMVGVEWLPLADLMKVRLYPMRLREELMDLQASSAPVYVGATG
ncbi:NUDIX domain-containing protein [Brevibacillus dissolubilis]|uniref:NUDIX domain-containing protein n=1 Tax=Brevibacillus dissolubilis TaxID=1844116 RepID=UPI00159B9AA2|nr:NUDIX domain-containing protein [Brevibacillus dissolubilis]